MSFFRSTILLPLAAGRVISQEDGVMYHDGSIASLVTLVLITAIVSANLLVSEFEPSMKTGFIPGVNTSYVLLIALQFCGLLLSIILTVLLKLRLIWTETQEVQHAIKLRLIFLMIFALGGVINNCLNVACNVLCLTRTFNVNAVSDCKTEILTNTLTLVYIPIEIVVLKCLVRYKLRPSKLVHYSLSFQVGTYISFWIYYLLEGLKGTFIKNRRCGNESTILRILNVTDPLVSPTAIGFSLLVVLLLASIWPNTTENVFSGQELKYVNSEEQLLLLHSTPQRNERKLKAILIGGFLVNIPLLIFTTIYYYIQKGNFIHDLFHSTGLISKLILFISITRGYLLISRQSKVSQNSEKVLTFRNFLLLFGLWGLVMFETLNFISVSNEKFTRIEAIFLVQTVFGILTAVQITIFILQMRHYKLQQYEQFGPKIEKNCLFLVGFLFAYWFVDTFIQSHELLSTQRDTKIKNPSMFIIGRVLFPFVLFFRFQCVMLLYDMYKQLKRC